MYSFLQIHTQSLSLPLPFHFISLMSSRHPAFLLCLANHFSKYAVATKSTKCSHFQQLLTNSIISVQCAAIARPSTWQIILLSTKDMFLDMCYYIILKRQKCHYCVGNISSDHVLVMANEYVQHCLNILPKKTAK